MGPAEYAAIAATIFVCIQIIRRIRRIVKTHREICYFTSDGDTQAREGT